MKPLRLFAATGDGVARIDIAEDGTTEIHEALQGKAVQCVAVDPADPDRIFCGTHDDGVFKSRDGGETWEPAGEDIPHKRTPSIAISHAHQENGMSVVYAGTEPSNLYRSTDDGETWKEFSRLPELPSSDSWSFPPRPWTHHTRWVTPHFSDPDLIFVGIELGGVMRSLDGGETWEDRKPGAYTDSHAIKVHPSDPDRVYEAAGQGVAISTDRGDTWTPIDDGMDRHYSWALAIDPEDPDLWYVSASHSARYAHRSEGDAQAHLYRKRGSAPWELLDGNLSIPLDFMPYCLLTFLDQPGAVLMGMKNGEILFSEDEGEYWTRLDVKLPEILQLSAANAF
ncbi:MAG: WD40/YVTN/BNR-like repeat-containing protein [Chloroflexota bacterium]